MPAFILGRLQLPPDAKTVKGDTLIKNMSLRTRAQNTLSGLLHCISWISILIGPQEWAVRLRCCGKERRGTSGLPGPKGCRHEHCLTCDASRKFQHSFPHSFTHLPKCVLNTVFLSCGCHNRMPPTGQLQQQRPFCLRSGGWKSQIQVSAGPCSVWGRAGFF